jgi:hypothetical protein
MSYAVYGETKYRNIYFNLFPTIIGHTINKNEIWY